MGYGGLKVLVFFFFKQKTAYEMVRSDWSSDVCSSDLWRLTNASHSSKGFRAALNGWLEALDARAFQQQQAAAQLVTTAVVLLNGTLVGALVVGTFEALISIVNTGVMW